MGLDEVYSVWRAIGFGVALGGFKFAVVSTKFFRVRS